MSIELALLWANMNLRQSQARESVVQLFREAAEKNVEATLLAAPELTVSKKGYFARWTGRELVVVELSPPQQKNFGLVPNALYRQLESAPDGRELSATILATLTNIQIDAAASRVPSQPLTGTCHVQLEPLATASLRQCAFRARYFHPEMRRPITSFSYIDHSLLGGDDLRFTLPPIRSKHNPEVPCPSLALFLQLIRSDRQTNDDGYHCLSNVASTIVDLKSGELAGD